MLRPLLPGRGSYFIRAIDRFFGIPLVFILGLFKREREMPADPPQRIAVLMSVAIGDSVLFMSVVSDLKRRFPKATVTAFVGESNREFLERYKEVTVIALKILNPLYSVLKIRRSGTFDVWIDTGQWQRISALYSFFAKAKWKIGFRTLGQGRHFIFDSPVSHMKSVHELENYRNLVRGLGLSEFTLPAIPNDQPVEEGKVVVHAFAGGSKPHLKEWPEDNWVELINTLLGRGMGVFLTGTKADQERAEGIVRRTAKPYAVQVLAGKLSLNETIDEISRAEYVITVNTGILHIAAALGIRTIGLHGPTSVLRWGPVGKNVVGIQSKRSCSPCLNLGFDYGCPRNDCMKDLKPAEIINQMRFQQNI